VARRIEFPILPQPDDSTCGPTCVHAIYRAYGDRISLSQVISEIAPLETGGTLAVHLACHALRRGYGAAIYTYNLHVFDPTWFAGKRADLAEKLRRQYDVKDDPKLRQATDAYLEFLSLGGELRFEDLRGGLIRRHLRRQRPLLAGLSATYLYGCARETPEPDYDDVHGHPSGHFVVVYDYDRQTRRVWVADPDQGNPGFERNHYAVSMDRLIGAILLGVLTYDANVLVLEPPANPG
jgi:hypothetical protein